MSRHRLSRKHSPDQKQIEDFVKKQLQPNLLY